MALTFVYDDGGRAAAGYKGQTGDCGVRAVAIVTSLSYQVVYDQVVLLAKDERPRKGKTRSSPRGGIKVSTLGKLLVPLGWRWVPTMGIGTGCRVHLKAEELPKGRLVCRVSKHYVAVLDGVIHDTYEESRGGTRCVYGYWIDETLEGE